MKVLLKVDRKLIPHGNAMGRSPPPKAAAAIRQQKGLSCRARSTIDA